MPHATAYNRPVFELVLPDLPETPNGIALWLGNQGSLDRYLARIFAATGNR
jgi:hypothetical protein